jgi:hypothetical protein
MGFRMNKWSFSRSSIRERGRPQPAFIAGCLFAAALPLSALSEAGALLEADFTSTSWYTAWHNQNVDSHDSLKGEPPNANRVPSTTTTAGFVPHDGAALQIKIPQGTNSGTGLSFYPGKVLGKDPSELYLRYHLRFGSDWYQAQNGKLPGFGGTYNIAGWGGKPSDGTNGWSARGKFGEPCSNGKINVGSYVYHADMPGQYGDSFTWTDNCTNGLNRNQWYQIDYYAKVNRAGSSDGILRAWIDGKLVLEKTGLRFDDTGKYQIERVWMNVFHGGSKLAPQDMHLFIDNVVVSQTPITGDAKIPEAPSQVSVE